MNEHISKNEEKARETWLLRGRLTKGILVLTAVLIILFMTWMVFVYTKSAADQRFFNFLKPIITPALTRFMRMVTFLGNPQFLVPANILLVTYLLILKRGWLAIRVVVISIGGLLIKLGLKQLFHRLRPIDPVIEGGVSGYSFPSGHALLGVAFYGFLIWWAAINIANKWKQGFVIGFLLFTILLICFSRIYLRVHYMTDVLAGLSLGFVWLIFALLQVDKFEIRQVVKQKTIADQGTV